MMRAEPEDTGTEEGLGAETGVPGVGKTRVPVTRRDVIEWISWIVEALISIRVPGLN